LYPLSLNLPISIAQSQAKLPQAATSLVIHLSGVTQNFIHFFDIVRSYCHKKKPEAARIKTNLKVVLQ